MNIEAFRAYCIKKKGVTEDFPFGEETIVFKVMGKMFALADVDLFESINLKFLPERSIELRERFNGITPGFHMNKKHWNTISMDGSVPNELILNLIDHSYELVVQNLPKSMQAELEKIN